jgi:hypothetical protein
MLCNWTCSQNLCNLWNKLGDGNYSYERDGKIVTMVWEPPYDYVVVVNSTVQRPLLDKTIYSIMEPVYNSLYWETLTSYPKYFKAVWDYTNYTNQEWHLSKTRKQLLEEPIEKIYDKTVSTVLSDKYNDPGHKMRIDFAMRAQHEIDWHSFGGNRFRWKNYKGCLPSHKKDDAIFPYKYTFNCENFNIPGYSTEKLIDGILGECLVFYSGCPNKVIDSNAYVLLNLTNIEESITTIKQALEEDWYTLKLPFIKRAKDKILNETSFFPRLHKTIFSHSENNDN